MGLFDKQYSTGVGQGLATLADAFTNSSGRQLLGLKAENLSSRNLASQLVAAQRQFDLDQNQKAMAGIAERIAQNPNDQSLRNMQMGMQYGQPNAVAQAYGNYAKEADRKTGLENLGSQTANMGYFDETTGLPVNTNVSDLARINPNWSQIGSGSVAPSQIGAYRALEGDRTANENKTLAEIKSNEERQKYWKDKPDLKFTDSSGQEHSVPMSQIMSGGNFSDFARMMKLSPELGTLINKESMSKANLRIAESKALFQDQTYAMKFAKQIADTDKSIDESLLAGLKLKFEREGFDEKKKKLFAESMIAQLKAEKENIKKIGGDIKGWQWHDDGSLSAYGIQNGELFSRKVRLGEGVPQDPELTIVPSTDQDGNTTNQLINKQQVFGAGGGNDLNATPNNPISKAKIVSLSGKTPAKVIQERNRAVKLNSDNKPKLIKLRQLTKNFTVTGIGGAFNRGLEGVAKGLNFDVADTASEAKTLLQQIALNYMSEFTKGMSPVSERDMKKVDQITKGGLGWFEGKVDLERSIKFIEEKANQVAVAHGSPAPYPKSMPKGVGIATFKRLSGNPVWKDEFNRPDIQAMFKAVPSAMYHPMYDYFVVPTGNPKNPYKPIVNDATKKPMTVTTSFSDYLAKQRGSR